MDRVLGTKTKEVHSSLEQGTLGNIHVHTYMEYTCMCITHYSIREKREIVKEETALRKEKYAVMYTYIIRTDTHKNTGCFFFQYFPFFPYAI